MPPETTNTSVDSENIDSGNHLDKKIIGLVLLVVVVVVAVGAYSFYYFEKKKSLLPEAMKGAIYMNLAPPNSVISSPFKFDFETNSLSKVKLKPNSVVLTQSFSIDGTTAVYSGILNTESSSVFQIYIKDVESGKNTRITKTKTVVKRHPEFSPDSSLIAYTTREERDADMLVPENWNVYVIDREGNEKFTTSGSYPKWSPDGTQLLILRNDGLYTYDIQTGKSTLQWKIVNGVVTMGMMYDVSQDGKLLAWTNPKAQRIFMAEILSWSPFSFEIKTPVLTEAFWPVFSPDGNFLAFEEVDIDYNDDLDPTNPRLVIYDIYNKYKQEIVDLSDYNQMALFLSDWTY